MREIILKKQKQNGFKELKRDYISKNYLTVLEKKQIMKARRDYRLYPHRVKKFSDINELFKELHNGKKI